MNNSPIIENSLRELILMRRVFHITLPFSSPPHPRSERDTEDALPFSQQGY